MDVKIWFNDGKTPKPEDPVFFEIAADGFYVHKKMPFWETTIPVSQISVLNKGNSSLNLFLPKFPAPIVKDILRFFAWIFKERKTEVGALIWYNENTRAYRVSIPRQLVSPASITYTNPWQEKLPGESLVASFHSHCAMEAFHSSVDEGDEMSFNGIHVTFGRFPYYGKATEFAISIEAAMNGTRFKLDPIDWLDGVEKVGDVTEDAPYEKEGEREAIYSKKNPYSWWRSARNSDSYQLKDGELILPDDYSPPEEWVQKVQSKTLFGFGGEKHGRYDKKTWVEKDVVASDFPPNDQEGPATGILTGEDIVKLEDENAAHPAPGVLRRFINGVKSVIVNFFVNWAMRRSDNKEEGEE